MRQPRLRPHRADLDHPSQGQVLVIDAVQMKVEQRRTSRWTGGNFIRGHVEIGNAPQKNDPGRFDDLLCRSIPISPTASTAAALGAYPDSRTSKSVK
jgi:hypothetical protein